MLLWILYSLEFHKKAFYCFMHKHKSHERNGEMFYVLKSYNVCYLSSISPSYVCMGMYYVYFSRTPKLVHNAKFISTITKTMKIWGEFGIRQFYNQSFGMNLHPF